jgi:hypothetical protein
MASCSRCCKSDLIDTYVASWNEAFITTKPLLNSILSRAADRKAHQKKYTFDVGATMEQMTAHYDTLLAIMENVKKWHAEQQRSFLGLKPSNYKMIGSFFLTVGTGVATIATQAADKQAGCYRSHGINWTTIGCQSAVVVLSVSTGYFTKVWRDKKEKEGKAKNILNMQNYLTVLETMIMLYQDYKEDKLQLVFSPQPGSKPEQAGEEISPFTLAGFGKTPSQLPLQDGEERKVPPRRQPAETREQAYLDQVKRALPTLAPLLSDDPSVVALMQEQFSPEQRGSTSSPSSPPTISIRSTQISVRSPHPRRPRLVNPDDSLSADMHGESRPSHSPRPSLPPSRLLSSLHSEGSQTGSAPTQSPLPSAPDTDVPSQDPDQRRVFEA